jgi:hypothetical protein
MYRAAARMRTARRAYRGTADLVHWLRDYLEPLPGFRYGLGFLKAERESARRLRISRWLHTNACGDFTLLAREDWFRLRGYPEWPIFSWHIDSAFLYAANAQGIHEMALGPRYRIYHIDHSQGWSPAEGWRLFERLDAKGVPYFDNKALHDFQVQVAQNPSSAIFNGENWGLVDYVLPEREILPYGMKLARSKRKESV